MSGCTCRLFIPMCTGSGSGMQIPLANIHWRFLLVRDDWGFQVNPLCRHDITSPFPPSGNEGYVRNRDVPLHAVYLRSHLVTGLVKVAVQSQLPLKGISLILGNDLAGSKVSCLPEVVDIPCVSESNSVLTQEFPNVFHSCVVTRAQARKFESTCPGCKSGEKSGQKLCSIPALTV